MPPKLIKQGNDDEDLGEVKIGEEDFTTQPEQFLTFNKPFYKAGWPETNSDDELKDQLTYFSEAAAGNLSSFYDSAEVVSNGRHGQLNDDDCDEELF